MNNAYCKALLGVALFCMLTVGRTSAVLAADGGSASPTVPWYRDMSTIIAFTALAFSFGTTFVSYRRTEKQDIQSSRQELRGILHRLSAIPRENLKASKEYAGDPSAVMGVSQLSNQETTLLARQAAEIVGRLPKGVVSGTEYYAIAIAFQSSYNLSAAKEFLTMATLVANNFNDEIGAIRSSANLDFITGEPQKGRVLYQQALNIFAKYSNYDPYTIASAHIGTELFWGGSEATIGQFQLAAQHVNNAQRLVDGLPVSMGSDALKAQIEQARQQFARAASPNSAGTPAVPVQSWMQQPTGQS